MVETRQVEAVAIHPGHGGGGGRGVEDFCRCPFCDYLLGIEEGQQCSQLECPKCGTSLVPASITQDEEPFPIVPFLITFGFFGLLAYMIGKKPFG